MAQQEVRIATKKVRLLYSFLFIPIIRLLFFVASFFNSKARRGYHGRRNLFEELEEKITRLSDRTRVWFHASSLGEFEQAKPIIEILKKAGYNIIVSFFSPSGYEHSQNYSNADVVTYIPLDSGRNAERFIRVVKPRVVVVMRYDLWMNHLIAAKEAGAKIIVADATFSVKLMQRAKFLRDFYKEVYSLADLVLATNSDNKKMFDYFLGEGITEVAGDTRFDRVCSRRITNDLSERIPFKIDKSKRIVMILGSTWRSDIDIVGEAIKKLASRFAALLIFIVPHEPTAEEVGRLREQFPEARLLSEIKSYESGGVSFLIIDRVGLLTQLYVLGDIAYVGGGFGAGVHSVLEPAVYGMPIITGPRIERSDEAMQLMQDGALFFIKDSEAAYEMMLRMVENASAREKAGRIAKDYVDKNLGASSLVADRIMSFSAD